MGLGPGFGDALGHRRSALVRVDTPPYDAAVAAEGLVHLDARAEQQFDRRDEQRCRADDGGAEHDAWQQQHEAQKAPAQGDGGWDLGRGLHHSCTVTAYTVTKLRSSAPYYCCEIATVTTMAVAVCQHVGSVCWWRLVHETMSLPICLVHDSASRGSSLAMDPRHWPMPRAASSMCVKMKRHMSLPHAAVAASWRSVLR